MKKAILIIFMFSSLLIFNACEEQPPVADAPETVQSVDIDRYVGLWYELASYPQWFSQNCFCTTAEYEILPSGKVKVTNKCQLFDENGPISRNVGTAVPVEGSNNTKLTVSFLPNNQGSEFGNYWIIELADDYSYAVVSGPQREQWYLLSRTPEIDPDLMFDIIERAVEDGFERDRIRMTSQDCN